MAKIKFNKEKQARDFASRVDGTAELVGDKWHVTFNYTGKKTGLPSFKKQWQEKTK